MKWIGTIKDIEYLYFVNNNILLQKKEQLESLNDKTSINIKLSNSFYWRNYFYQRTVTGVNIFDSDLSLAFQYDLENVSGVIDIFEKDSFVLSTKEGGNNFYYFIKNGEAIKKQSRFFGKILNEFYRLSYPEGTFTNPRQFRCSDLLDEQTYWEYDCGDGYAAGRFYVWNKTLVFSKSKDMHVQLISIDLSTGKIDWEVQIINGSFFFNVQNGILVSVWGSQKEGGQYQIIHLDKHVVEVGRLEDFSMEYVRVNWETQFLANNKYYFTESVYTTGNEKPRPIRFGRFDIETKTIDFLQEVPEAAGDQFAQVIYHEHKLYLRTVSNKLFIFEDEV